ncbi:hypothetical protein AAZX31_20G182900 [Glycine max]
MPSEVVNNCELHVVMFPFLAFGHISPFVQLSNKLFSHGVRVTFLSAASNIPKIRSTLNLNPAITVIPLQFPNGIANTAELPPHLAGNLIHALDLTQDQVKSLLLELKPHYVFFDFAQNWIPKLASEVGIKSVHFSVYSAISDASITVPSRFDDVEGRNINFEDLKKPPPALLCPKSPMGVATCTQIASDSCNSPLGLHPLQKPAKACPNSLVMVATSTCRQLATTSGVFHATWLRTANSPLTITVCYRTHAKYVENNPHVIFFKRTPFGKIFCKSTPSGEICLIETFLNEDQIKELATGLELIGLPFILVLNFPSNLSAKAELERALTKGFLERVKNRGVVHTGWFQQQLALKHSSLGCYVCHGGFSSVIEALINECQLVLLPFKGDQFFNSKLIANDLKAGVEVNRGDEGGFFHKEDIIDAIKTIMMEDNKEQGKQTRESHMQWSMFLSNQEIQNKFITDMVAQLKSMA